MVKEKHISKKIGQYSMIGKRVKHTKLTILKSFSLAFISGILLFLSFPKYGTWMFAWVALIPLLNTIKNKDASVALVLGFVTGFIFNVGIIYWVIYAIVKYGNLPVYTGTAAMFLLAAYLAIYTAIFGYGLAYLNQRRIPQIISAPILWTGLEFIKSNIFTGFPWENFAYSQYLNLTIIQVADVTGIYGLSFLIVFINAVIHDVIFTTTEKKPKLCRLMFALILLLLVYGYGALRIQDIDNHIEHAQPIYINLVQGNIDQSLKWTDQVRDETIHIYKKLSLQESHNGTGIIIWPETAVPFYFQDINDLHRIIIEIPKTTNKWLLIGSPSYLKEHDEIFSSNSAFIISPESKITDKYDKVHLVPFGEYVPLRKYLPFMEKIVVGIGDFKAGEDYTPIMMNNIKIGTMICYEGIFPEAARRYKKQGVGLFVNITNDAWYGKTSAPYQHLSMVVFRSIENRVYLARAANTGISAIIDAKGKIISKTELFERTSLQGTIKIMDNKTIYSQCGDIFAYLCLAGLIILVLISIKKGERTK